MVEPTLYGRTSTGKVKQWTVSVKRNGDDAFLIKEFGYIDGSIKVSKKNIKGKNIGKSNETTPFQQACLVAKSSWRSKQDEGYREVIPEKDQLLLLPMLALKFQERKHNIIMPCSGQPKLNGIRDLTQEQDSIMQHITRKGKRFKTLQHFNPFIRIMTKRNPSILLDGEIYNHEWIFQQISRATKKYREGITEQLQYWVYDMLDLDNREMTFLERHAWIEEQYNRMIGDLGKDAKSCPILTVPTFDITKEEEVYNLHDRFVRDRYEGIMLRNNFSIYILKHRTKHLQKYKEFEDAEFPIIGGKAATGSHEGCVVFICITPEGEPFDVVPKRTLEKRREMYINLPFYIGKDLTVHYQELSEDKIPIFPVGYEIRDYED